MMKKNQHNGDIMSDPLAAPITIRGQTLSNRIIMGSMHTGLEEAKDGFESLARFYEERAKGGTGLIITGGVSPNWTGRLSPFACDLSFPWQVSKHRRVTDAVHKYPTKIVLQLLHAGRYAFHPFSAAPSKLKAPISPFKPHEMSHREIEKTIRHFGRAARLAERAGYDGVEIMGSEGYLLNQFMTAKTNHRKDQWGGDIVQRTEFCRRVVMEVRKNVSEKFIIVYRISLMDLVERGNTLDEVLSAAKILEVAGVDIFDSGIGWHEARVPTIYLEVPRAHFAFATQKLKNAVNVPVIATNRLNMPEVARKVLLDGAADFVSLARPLLADPEWANKAIQKQDQRINTCIACNQACLDHIFVGKKSSCLVNPMACDEQRLRPTRASSPKKVAVIGAGPAGLQAACTLAERGHQVTLFEKNSEIGGQLCLAARIPGKEEFRDTLRYFSVRLQELGVVLKLKTQPDAQSLLGFDDIVIATGVKPRDPKIDGLNNESHLNYQEFLLRNPVVEGPIVIIGGGPIAIDVAEKIIRQNSPHEFNSFWGIDSSGKHPGWLQGTHKPQGKITITLCQRSESRIGMDLGKTSGWIHRDFLKKNAVTLVSGIQYHQVTSEGLVIIQKGEKKLLPAKQVLVCAGQVSENSLANDLTNSNIGMKIHLIGGAKDATKIDAKRSIREGHMVGLQI